MEDDMSTQRLNYALDARTENETCHFATSRTTASRHGLQSGKRNDGNNVCLRAQRSVIGGEQNNMKVYRFAMC